MSERVKLGTLLAAALATLDGSFAGRSVERGVLDNPDQHFLKETLEEAGVLFHCPPEDGKLWCGGACRNWPVEG